MSNYDAELRIFQSLRMHPWIPEHKVFIDAELAKLDVLDPPHGASLRKEYDDKMNKYLEENTITLPLETAPAELVEQPVAPAPKAKKAKTTKKIKTSPIL